MADGSQESAVIFMLKERQNSMSSCKMVDGSQESAVISMLKELQDSMNSMKEENSHIKERLDVIENPNRGFRLGPRA